MTCWSNHLISTLLFIAAALPLPAHAVDDSRAAKPEPKIASYRPTSDTLFMKYAPAMAKITVRLHGVPVLSGAGFFVSADGLLMTNHHLVRNVINSPNDYSAEITLADKRSFTKFQVAGCGDRRLIDLCVLKVAAVPKAVLTLSEEKPDPGATLYAFGHPRGLDFALTRGTLNGFRITQPGVSELDIKAQLAPGNSGGPILDERGQVVGIVTKSPPEEGQVGVGIAGAELTNFLGLNTAVAPLNDARVAILGRMRADTRKIATLEIEPAIALAARGLQVSDLKGFRDFTFNLDGQFIKLSLPSFLESCAKTRKAKENTIYVCTGYGDAMAFTVQRFQAQAGELLEKKNGRVVLESKPIDVVDALKHEASWEKIEKGLSAQSRKDFYSKPGPAECGSLHKNNLPGAIFSGSWACRFNIVNDSEAGSHSVNIWLERGQDIYSFGVWVNDSVLSPAFSAIPTLAALTARADGATQEQVPRAVANDVKQDGSYELPLTEPLAYIGPKSSAGLNFDMYGKKRGLSGGFDESYVLAVSGHKATVMPPDYDELARDLALRAIPALGYSVKEKAPEAEAANVAKKPARMLTMFGKDKTGRDAVVYVCVIFDSDRVFTVVQGSRSLEPSAAYRELKALLSSFKLK